MRIYFCTPGHHLCLGIVSYCICVHQLALLAGPGDLHTFPGLYVAYMYPRQCAQAPGMYMMEHNDPRGCAMLSLHRCAQGYSGRAPFCRNDAADALQVLFIFINNVHGVFRQTVKHLYLQTLSSASAGHERMCACKPCLCLCSTSSLCLDPWTVYASSFRLS